MIGRLAGFAHELRTIGIPVSMVEVIDAAEAARHADLHSPDGLRVALAATMIKTDRHRDAFDRAFDVYFELAAGSSPSPAPDARIDDPAADPTIRIADALDHGDRERLLELIREAVERFGRTGVGTSGGGSYYAYRVLRRLDPDRIRALLFRSAGPLDGLDEQIARDRIERLIALLRAEVRREVIRRLVDERGTAAVARSVRETLVEDLDLQHANGVDIASIERIVAPLARRLATRLAQRRRRGARGRLDVRRTIRRSLTYGGALVEPQFRSPKTTKPQIVLLCDTSGSMATFSRFAMQLTYAISSELSGVRSFVFIEGVDEVTRLFDPDRAFAESLSLVAGTADVVRADGHSDYGTAFTEFADRYLASVTARTIVLVTGDGRSNYRHPEVEAFRAIGDRARAVMWLNPEPARFWDTGDSVMGAYAPWCDRVDEVRTLRQLERFVERAVLPNAAERRSARMGRTTLPVNPMGGDADD